MIVYMKNRIFRKKYYVKKKKKEEIIGTCFIMFFELKLTRVDFV